MKLDSPLFDRIRVKPGEDRRPQAAYPVCDWPDCHQDATHRAPKGRLREGEYWRFCLQHVREYNHSYNFFAGMSEDAITRYQKEAITGHRPTWKIGVNGKRAPAGPTQNERWQFFADDPFGLFQETDRAPGHDSVNQAAVRDRQRDAGAGVYRAGRACSGHVSGLSLRPPDHPRHPGWIREEPPRDRHRISRDRQVDPYRAGRGAT